MVRWHSDIVGGRLGCPLTAAPLGNQFDLSPWLPPDCGHCHAGCNALYQHLGARAIQAFRRAVAKRHHAVGLQAATLAIRFGWRARQNEIRFRGRQNRGGLSIGPTQRRPTSKRICAGIRGDVDTIVDRLLRNGGLLHGLSSSGASAPPQTVDRGDQWQPRLGRLHRAASPRQHQDQPVVGRALYLGAGPDQIPVRHGRAQPGAVAVPRPSDVQQRRRGPDSRPKVQDNVHVVTQPAMRRRGAVHDDVQRHQDAVPALRVVREPSTT